MAGWLRYSKRRLFIALVVLSMAAAVFGRGLTSYLRQAAQIAIAPAGDLGMYVVTSLKAGAGDRQSRGLSSAEIHQIIEDNRQLRAQLIEEEESHRQAERRLAADLENIQAIRRSFHPREDIPYELMPARVVAMDSLPYRQGRVVNVGTSGGVVRGAPAVSRLLMTDRSKEMPPRLAVLTASALVGRLESAGPFTARLQLVTDSNFAVRARVRRQIDPDHPRQVRVLLRGAAGIETLTERNNLPVGVLACGDGARGLTADAPAHENVLPGDWLVTADDDPYLRTEIRIGVVTEVNARPDDPGSVTLRVRPFEDLASLRHVYILYWKPP